MADSKMTVRELIVSATDRLGHAGVETARLDILLLLTDEIGNSKSWLLAHPETELTPTQVSNLQKQIARRTKHEPLAYIRGKTEFYGREFIVDSRVLEPRPESETMIELLTQGLKDKGIGIMVVDVGTGSGALAITTKLELPKTQVTAIDIDPKCLKVAQKNALNHKADIEFVQSNLLENIPLTSYRLPLYILANLPYVPDDYHINPAALHEPTIAIFGGTDGLDTYRKLFKQAASLKTPSTCILTEALPFQHEELTKIAVQNGFTQTRSEDFIQLFEKRPAGARSF